MFTEPLMYLKIINPTGYDVVEVEGNTIIGIVRKDPANPKRWLYEDVSHQHTETGYKTRKAAGKAMWWELIGNLRMEALRVEYFSLAQERMRLPQISGWKPKKQHLAIPVDYANRICDILMEHAGLSVRNWTRDSLLHHHTEAEYISTEHRIGSGLLGHGGKFRNDGGAWYVDCYSEHIDFESLPAMIATNKALLALWVEYTKPLENTL